ncbi:MAG: hypothetical protein V3U75_07785 [Methylococcaceae bacterium]
MHPAIIDIEASGFGSQSYPIEIGLILSSGEKFCFLIKPAVDWIHWNNEAEKLHLIDQKMLKIHGDSLENVARSLNYILKNKVVYSDGWVVDQPWLIKLFHTAGILQQFMISPLESILSEAQMNIWHETKIEVLEQLNISRHRASNDAKIIQETYCRTYNIIQQGRAKKKPNTL